MGAGAADGLHLRSFLCESGLASSVRITIQTDSSSGKSIASQHGVSRRTRHVQLRFLFLQELVEIGRIKLKKIDGVKNCADIFTKHVKADVLQKHLKEVGITSSVDKYFIGMLNHTSNFETINFTDLIQNVYDTKTQYFIIDEFLA